MSKPKLIRITTVPSSLKILLKGQHNFMANYFQVIGISAAGDHLNDVEKEGIRVIPVEMTRTISPYQDIKSVYRLYRLFKKEKPLIVHTHTPKAGIAGMLAAKLAGVKIRLHTVAGLPLMEASGFKRTILNSVEKLTYRCASYVYPNSKGLYDFILTEKFTLPRKLKVIANGSSNGIDTNYFDPSIISEEDKTKLKNELGISKTDFVFCFVGRLVGDKGINELVKAFKNICETEKNCKLVLVGGAEELLDPLNPETTMEVTDNKNILAVGFQNDVRHFFAISNALVFPTYREGFPNVVMQAGAMGLPSIVTNINGCNEIIVEGKNGTIIPTKDTKAIEESMRHFLQKKESMETTMLCREMIVDRYQREIVWEALLTEYKTRMSRVS